MKNLSILTILLSLVFLSCKPDRKTNESSSGNTFNNDTNEVTTPPPTDGSGNGGTDPGNGTGYGDGNEDGTPDAGQTQDYISVNNIIAHSKLHASNTSRSYIWSSYHNLGSSDQGMFYTNSRFNVRVRAQNAPPKGNDSSGEYCKWQEYQDFYKYTQLDIEVCVRKQTGSCIQTHTFEKVPVGQVSKVKEFSIPASATPLVVEILDIRWDTGCRYDRGLSDRYCPTYSVWREDCVKFDVQFSTDYTKDFPASAPRY